MGGSYYSSNKYLAHTLVMLVLASHKRPQAPLFRGALFFASFRSGLWCFSGFLLHTALGSAAFKDFAQALTQLNS